MFGLLAHAVAVVVLVGGGYYAGAKYGVAGVKAAVKADLAALEAKAASLEASAKAFVLAEIAKIKIKL